MPSTYTLRHVAGYSPLDHLAAEIIRRAGERHATKRAASAALRQAVVAMRATMGPRSWPRIDIVRAN